MPMQATYWSMKLLTCNAEPFSEVPLRADLMQQLTVWTQTAYEEALHTGIYILFHPLPARLTVGEVVRGLPTLQLLFASQRTVSSVSSIFSGDLLDSARVNSAKRPI
jgi:hypothetical protein